MEGELVEIKFLSGVLYLIDGFWSKVERSGDCWLWTGEKNSTGYGVYAVHRHGERERILAHRFSARLSGMELRSPDDVVLHECDTPLCVRPDHLRVGTQKENLRDALAKGRLNLAGLTSAHQHQCRRCEQEFWGAPKDRFCGECRKELMEAVLAAAEIGESQYVTARRLGISQSSVRAYLKRSREERHLQEAM
jgi:hypothetical protein